MKRINVSTWTEETKKINRIEEKYLIPIKECGCCGGRSFKTLFPYRKEFNINFIKCKKCGAITYNKTYSQEGLDKIYSSEHFYDSYDREGKTKVTFNGTDRFARHLLKLMKDYPIKKNHISILDFGGGSGEIVYKTARLLADKYGIKQVDITVVDYPDELYSEGDSRISAEHRFPLLSINDRTYDIVIASAIIEHIPKPGEVVRKLFSLTGAGGLIYFRTPCAYPLYRLLNFFGIEYEMVYPQHLWDFGCEWLEGIAKHCGYDKGDIKVVRSRSAIVEKSFDADFFVTLCSYILKAPSFITHKWQYVGGWEILCRKDRRK